MLLCLQASGYSSLEDSFDHDVSRQGSVHLEEDFPRASEEGEKTGGVPFLLPFTACFPVCRLCVCGFSGLSRQSSDTQSSLTDADGGNRS